MIKLKITLWELLARGAALYMAAVFMMRGQMLKRRLRHALIDNRRERGALIPCRDMPFNR